MSYEKFTFEQSAPLEKIVEATAASLKNGDWSEDHAALIAGVEPDEEGHVQIRFFENNPEPETVAADKILRVIRAPGN